MISETGNLATCKVVRFFLFRTPGGPVNSQLYQVLEAYQTSGDVQRLLFDTGEMIRFLPRFGAAARAVQAARYVLLSPLPNETSDDAREHIRNAVERLKEADATLDDMGVHPVVGPPNTFAFFPFKFIEGEVCTVYGWDGNTLYAGNGDYNETYAADGTVERQLVVARGPFDNNVQPSALPFVALVKAVLILAAEAVRSARSEE